MSTADDNLALIRNKLALIQSLGYHVILNTRSEEQAHKDGARIMELADEVNEILIALFKRPTREEIRTAVAQTQLGESEVENKS